VRNSFNSRGEDRNTFLYQEIRSMTDTKHQESNSGSGGCGSGGCGGGAASALQNAVLQGSLSRIQHKLIVMSGKGGVGKSSVSANLAAELGRRGYQVGLMDVDLHGPSIAGMMGIKGLLDVSDKRRVLAKTYKDNVKVVSMQSLLMDGDQPVIWRGPAKNGVIRQFISDVQWGELDFLVIDAPPGTGDEPLSVVQAIPDAKAVIVTTPQQVALADVRKSINFCRTVQLEIVGVLENMGPFACPCCNKIIAPFQGGGGAKMAQETAVYFLGTLPFDPKVVKACDDGIPIIDSNSESAFSIALSKSVDMLLAKLL
jgi:ATP-binding protein involved in chromosome partitioning